MMITNFTDVRRFEFSWGDERPTPHGTKKNDGSMADLDDAGSSRLRVVGNRFAASDHAIAADDRVSEGQFQRRERRDLTGETKQMGWPGEGEFYAFACQTRFETEDAAATHTRNPGLALR